MYLGIPASFDSDERGRRIRYDRQGRICPNCGNTGKDSIFSNGAPREEESYHCQLCDITWDAMEDADPNTPFHDHNANYHRYFSKESRQ